jgi:excinuclease UvrABC nuclease subunit
MNGLKIEYTIDNFSELISVDDYVELSPKSKVNGVYFLYSIDKELLYIGKSASCMRGRLCNHLITETPNRYNDELNERTLKKRKDYAYFAYTIVDKEFLDMVERFLIQKYKPKFNIEFNYT